VTRAEVNSPSAHGSIDDKLRSLGIRLPPPPPPSANYQPFCVSGKLLFLSGQGPGLADGTWLLGKVGSEVSAEDAYTHARIVGLRLLSAAQLALGSLENVKRVVKLLGFVNATPKFTDHPQVINGCSDLLVEVFGDAGRHARSAVGVGSLPRNMTVEIEAIFEIR
jgi:enamine deaminase RidA (YjgF/YER057c/UK114 family)